jgi:hypothetical protein
MQALNFNDQEARLFEMGGGFIAVRDGYVHQGDLANLKPGGIVRCRAKPDDCIKVFYGAHEPIGCVAGWVSEEA